MRLPRYVFQIAAGLLVLGALLHVTTLWPRVVALSSLLPTGVWLFFVGFAICVLTALSACALAAFLLWKAPDRADARALTLFLAFLALYWGSLFRFMNVQATENSVDIGIRYGGGWLAQSALAAFVLAVAAFVRFSALFPQPLTADRLPRPKRFPMLHRWRAATLRPAIVWGSAVAVILVFRFGSDVAALFFDLPDQPTAVPPAFIMITVATGVLCILYALAGLILGTRNLRTSYRISAPEERKRVLWVVSGFTIAAFMVLSAVGLLLLVVVTKMESSLLGIVVPLIVLAPLVLVICAAIGILYAGAIDPALVLRRSTVWGAIGAAGVILFAAIENGLSSLLEDRLHLPAFAGAMISGSIVAVLLIPVRARVQRWVNARMAVAAPGEAVATPIAHPVASNPLTND
jgi:hypothetical protein